MIQLRYDEHALNKCCPVRPQYPYSTYRDVCCQDGSQFYVIERLISWIKEMDNLIKLIQKGIKDHE